MIPLPTLEGIASQYSGTPTSISCESPVTFAPDLLGFVRFVDGQVVATIHLPASTCSSLEHIDKGDITPLDVLTLVHEATHISLDSTDECVVETTALANAWQVVRQLKLPAWRTRAILAGLPSADQELQPAYSACRVAS